MDHQHIGSMYVLPFISGNEIKLLIVYHRSLCYQHWEQFMGFPFKKDKLLLEKASFFPSHMYIMIKNERIADLYNK